MGKDRVCGGGGIGKTVGNDRDDRGGGVKLPAGCQSGRYRRTSGTL